MAQEPFHLMNGPFEVWAADPVEAAPDIAATPAGNWVVIGVAGDQDISEAGIIVRVEQDVSSWKGLGALPTRKQFRTSQDIVVEFTVADATMEAYAHALNEATIDSTSWRRRIDLLMTSEVAQQSLLVRGDGKSPYGDFNTQWWIPRASHSAPVETVYVKGEPVGLKFTFTAILDDTDDIGFIESQDEAS